MYKKTTLRCKKSRVYMGFLCRFNKKQCENQKEERSGKVGTVEKAEFEINIKIARIVPNGAVNELCRIWSKQKNSQTWQCLMPEVQTKINNYKQTKILKQYTK